MLEQPAPKRKLIEVALPLEAINRESAREKSIRHGHPSTLHLWWARRPLAAARAMLFAQLVDDPSSSPLEFPTEDLQRKERERLHRLIERLVVWENINNKKLLAEAHAEILKSTGNNPPPILDPFAGGGSIPLEAQRLGLESHASDLNPVAVLINKALIEIPPKFRNQPPSFPGLASSQIRQWSGAEGLAADVVAYGNWIRDEAEKRIGHMYPKAKLPHGSTAPVIAWIWARTIICPNPGCAIEMPLVRSWWLSKKKDKEAYIKPRTVPDPSRPNGYRVAFEIKQGRSGGPDAANDGTVGRVGAVCTSCGTSAELAYVRAEGKAGRIGRQLLATVAADGRQRVFCEATLDQEEAAALTPPENLPPGELPEQALGFRVQAYGMKHYTDLFTPRQLHALVTFSDLVIEARQRVQEDSGRGDYANAVATYLGLGVSRFADIANSLCSWENTKTQVRHLFTRQAISMLWDFAEAPPFGKAAGAYEVSLASLVKAIVDTNGPQAQVSQADASTRSYEGQLLSTDPPYYDNIQYSDLSDFFYVWLRRSLRDVYPELFSTLLVPKAEELVANPYRHDGREGAKQFFEDGFARIFARARESALWDYPIAVIYAFKQSEVDEAGESSTGWETLLEGMIRSGWEITATWPNRSELSNRMRGQASNALASSIILALRPRPDDSPTTDRRGFIAALESTLPDALRKLQQGQISPVDLPQAAIGPGMAVFSRYDSVLEPDGTRMTVRSALARINQMLDQVLNEQEGDFDSTTRFAIAWYRQHGYGTGAFGDANNLANARNTTVDAMDRGGILNSRAGKVQLIRPGDLSVDYDVSTDLHASNWEGLHHLIKSLEAEGISPAGEFLRTALNRPDGAVDSDLIKELAHLLFRIAESKGWTKDAISFNGLVTSWPDILEAARADSPKGTAQSTFDFSEEEAD